MNDNLLSNSKSYGLPILVAPNDLPKYLPAVTRGGLRREIFDAMTNGLAASGALLKRGRKLYIDVNCYVEWIRSQSYFNK